MSFFVRWTEDNLNQVGKDKKLTTALMNEHTLTGEMAKHYPYHLRREFYARWYGEDEEPVRIYATDVTMARWWISENYTRPPDELWETKTRVMELNPNPARRPARKVAPAKRQRKPRLTR